MAWQRGSGLIGEGELKAETGAAIAALMPKLETGGYLPVLSGGAPRNRPVSGYEAGWFLFVARRVEGSFVSCI